MEQNGIPFKGPVREIVAQASHISDSGHILPVPVLDYGHETGDVSFYRAFIQNVSLGKTVMGKSGRIIGNHDRDGTLVSNIPINPLVRQSAAHHAFLRRNILCRRFRFCFRLSGNAFRNGFSGYRRHFFRRGFLISAACKEHRGGKPKQKQYAQFFHLNTSLS